MTTTNLPPPALPTVAVSTRYGDLLDLPAVRDMLTRCSPDTLHRRFHTPTTRLADRSLRQLLAPPDGWSVVAHADARLVALGCAGALSAVDVEVGLLVEDGHQGRGIGARLLHEIAVEAHARGFVRLRCLTQPDNDRVPSTAHRAGLSTSLHQDDGLLYVDIDLHQVAGELARPA